MFMPKGKDDEKHWSAPPNAGDKYSHKDLEELKEQISILNRELKNLPSPESFVRSDEIQPAVNLLNARHALAKSIEISTRLNILAAHITVALANTNDETKKEKLGGIQTTGINILKTLTDGIMGRLNSTVNNLHSQVDSLGQKPVISSLFSRVEGRSINPHKNDDNGASKECPKNKR